MRTGRVPSRRRPGARRGPRASSRRSPRRRRAPRAGRRAARAGAAVLAVAPAPGGPPAAGRRSLDALRGGDEAVAAAGQRLHEARGLGVVVERVADLHDAEVQAALEVDEDVLAPEVATQLLARDEPAGLPDEERQDPSRLLLEANGLAVPPELPGAQVELEAVRSEPPRPPRAAPTSASFRLDRRSPGASTERLQAIGRRPGGSRRMRWSASADEYDGSAGGRSSERGRRGAAHRALTTRWPGGHGCLTAPLPTFEVEGGTDARRGDRGHGRRSLLAASTGARRGAPRAARTCRVLERPPAHPAPALRRDLAREAEALFSPVGRGAADVEADDAGGTCAGPGGPARTERGSARAPRGPGPDEHRAAGAPAVWILVPNVGRSLDATELGRRRRPCSPAPLRASPLTRSRTCWDRPPAQSAHAAAGVTDLTRPGSRRATASERPGDAAVDAQAPRQARTWRCDLTPSQSTPDRRGHGLPRARPSFMGEGAHGAHRTSPNGGRTVASGSQPPTRRCHAPVPFPARARTRRAGRCRARRRSRLAPLADPGLRPGAGRRRRGHRT